MRRLGTIGIAVILCIGLLLAGCGKQTGVDKAPGETGPSQASDAEGKKQDAVINTGQHSNLNPPGTFPVVNEKITLKVFVAPEPWLGDFKDNWFTKWYEEKTNVHIEWMQVGRDDASQRINLLLSSQSDLPDIFMTGVSQELQVVYGSQGVFIPLNGYIEELGVEIKKLFEHDAQVKNRITAPDGNIYGLPEYNECYHCDYSQRAWINNTWLNKLGLSAPATTEEFYQVLKAFKENDCNDNGKMDEIPMAAPNDAWHGYVDGFLMNPFIFNDGSERMYFEGEKLKFAPIQPEWREGLRYMRKLYMEGLLDKEIFIMDTNQVRQLTESPEGNRVGAVTGGHHGVFCDISKDGAKLDFIPLAPLKGPDGLQQTPRFPTGINTCFVITKACKEPEVAFRWGDSMYSEEIYEIANNGEPEVDWRYAKPDEKGLDGRPGKIFGILPYGEPHNKHWGQPHPQMVTNEKRFELVVPQGEWSLEFELFKARKDFYDGLEPDKILPPLFMTPDEVVEAGELRTVIREYVKEGIARFVTGDLDLDKDWDKYTKEFENMGVDRLIKILEQVYRRQYGNQ